MLARVCVCVWSGGGPVLGGRPRGVGQSGPAADQDETPGGVSEDLGGAVFCCKYRCEVAHVVPHVAVCLKSKPLNATSASVSPLSLITWPRDKAGGQRGCF